MQIGFFRERTSDFSLKYRAIQPSEVFGARRKVVLRSEGNAWTLVSWSFDKLREVGELSYLSFTLYLSVLSCFGWFEALNGRLIGSKTWNRNEKKNYGTKWDGSDSVCIVWAVWVGYGEMCALNCIVMCVRPEMTVKFGFTK